MLRLLDLHPAGVRNRRQPCPTCTQPHCHPAFPLGFRFWRQHRHICALLCGVVVCLRRLPEGCLAPAGQAVAGLQRQAHRPDIQPDPLGADVLWHACWLHQRRAHQPTGCGEDKAAGGVLSILTDSAPASLSGHIVQADQHACSQKCWASPLMAVFLLARGSGCNQFRASCLSTFCTDACLRCVLWQLPWRCPVK